MVTYEQRLNDNLDWALREGSMHFEKESAVHKTLRKITRRLEELDIPYALVGGMAMFFHGYRRFTEDVGVLVTRDGLGEVQKLIQTLALSETLADELHSYVRDKYRELWAGLRDNPAEP